MKKLVLKNFLSPGDVVMLTAAVRDLHRSYPDQFETDVRTSCRALWENNPYISSIKNGDPDAAFIECRYPLIQQSNQAPYHFLHGYVQFLDETLGIRIRPSAFKGDIHLSPSEKTSISQVHEIVGSDIAFWLIASGGKYDCTAKWWAVERYQELVDHFFGKILFVQVGERNHYHPALNGALDLRGKTDLRQLVRLVYHSQGVVCPVTLLMHLAVAVEAKTGCPKNRPCIVIAGGREPAQWEAYPHHQYIHTNGSLLCCAQGGCWKSRVNPIGDGEKQDLLQNLCVDVVGRLPRCMHMITATDVVRRIEMYRQGGTIEYLSKYEAETVCDKMNHWNSRCSDNTLGGNWSSWSIRFDERLTEQNARQISEKFVSIIPPYSGKYEGRGIVISGGGLKHFPNAWVCIKMLRWLGCTLPIQLWHLGERELDDPMRELLLPLQVECVDALHVRATNPALILNGWELKCYAILNSPFKEVMLLDADNVPLVDPTFLFDSHQFKQTGAIFWPDYWRFQLSDCVWNIFGVSYRDEPQFESGQVIVDKEKCWRALRLAMWYNEHSDFFYRHVYGDKETFHMAFRKCDQLYSMPDTPIQPLVGTMCQHDFAGNRIFQHRNSKKWTLLAGNERIDDFLYEKECRQFLGELRNLWGLKRFNLFANPQRAYEVSSHIVSTIYDYHLVGQGNRRPMGFLENGTIDGDASERHVYWDLQETGDDVRLVISSEIGKTCTLELGTDNVWREELSHSKGARVELFPQKNGLEQAQIRPVILRIKAKSPSVKLPFTKGSFLSNEQCTVFVELIRKHAMREPPLQSTHRIARRTEIAGRLLSAQGLLSEAKLLAETTERCRSEIEGHFELVRPIYPEFVMLQGNYPGDCHVRHADNCRYDGTARKWVPNHTPWRVITCGVYLNECGVDFTGGELVFPCLERVIPPKPGLFVAYPSDERFEHEVPAVRLGSRYSILLWFTENAQLTEQILPPTLKPT